MPLLTYLLTKRSMGHYKVMIEEEIKKKNLPTLLYYLKKINNGFIGIVESGYFIYTFEKKMNEGFNLALNFIK